MSAVPQGAYATFKIKQNWQKSKESEWQGEQKAGSFNCSESVLEHPPLKYNSKLMNSVWGLYNRYSVHNLKKNADSVGLDVFSNQRYQA